MVTNISAYRFAPLDGLKKLRAALTEACQQGGLKGTILLSTEGINLFVAGPLAAINSLLEVVRAVPGLEGLEPKVSESLEQPFSRMLVRIKKEIIAFGIEGIDPARAPAPRVSPRELKRWLDEGRPLTLLDTRNDYEVELGTFKSAVPIGIGHFREFPAAVAKLPPLDQQHPIVTFCTGGIRCEKAAPYLIRAGFGQVFQLDGGILKYFEECGSEHFNGECFVFDKRVGLAADLGESGHGLCYACRSLLTREELVDPLTVPGVSCPRCYTSPEEMQRLSLEAHRAKLRQVTDPLPGREPLDNFRPLSIDARHDGGTMAEFLADVFPQVPASRWLERVANGEVLNDHRQPIGVDQRVRAGERYATRERLQVEPDVNADIEIIHEDDALIVVNKPAPLPMHPSGRYQRNTLQGFLQQVYAPQQPRPAHRLDANTSGVTLFTRTARFARQLQPQFAQGEVKKRYLARVVGHPPEDLFSCAASLATEPGRLGSRKIAAEYGAAATTECEVLRRFSDGTTLVMVRPTTGRTNQIRVHLWHLGWPIVGDATYLPDGRLGDTQTLGVDDIPLHLHAWQVSFRHPQHFDAVVFEAPPPEWAEGLAREPIARSAT
ncbi:MAG: RluA family pseudouridine synthase [Planctomycetota bacterium]